IYAGIGIYYKDGSKEITKPLPGNIRTNNRAELFAIIRSIKTCENQEKILEIRTDSRYVVNFDKLVNNRKGKIIFIYVKAHVEITENKIADKLARREATIDMWNQKKLSPYNSYMKNTFPKYKKENPSLDHKIAFKNIAAM
ncbi:6312_t:CDS:2, partial [Scutellospora calospora]